MESKVNQNNTLDDKIHSQHGSSIHPRETVAIEINDELSPSRQQTGDQKQNETTETLTQSSLTVQSGNPYNSGYDQGRLPEVLQHDHIPFSSWNVQRSDVKQEKVSDVRLFAAISILFNIGFGVAALVQAVRAREEYEKGNITRAKELNSIALGLGCAGIAISFFLGVIMVAQQLLA